MVKIAVLNLLNVTEAPFVFSSNRDKTSSGM